MRGVVDSAYQWFGESATPRIVELESRRLRVSLIRRVADSPYRWVGESFFEYEYLREFEAKIGTARNVVYGTYAEPIYAKTSENPVRFHVPLRGRPINIGVMELGGGGVLNPKVTLKKKLFQSMLWAGLSGQPGAFFWLIFSFFLYKCILLFFVIQYTFTAVLKQIKPL